MIYIKVEGHPFQYELFEVAKPYFDTDEIQFTDPVPPLPEKSIVISSTLLTVGVEYHITTRIQGPGPKQAEDHFVFPAGIEDINRDKEEKRRVRKEIKRRTSLLLASYTGKKLPWGILTGIRPAKIVIDMMEQGMMEEQILQELDTYYRLSAEKAQMVYEVAKAERVILSRSAPDRIALYIGIPFCPSTCLYCSFTSNPVGKYRTILQQYIDALKAEICQTTEMIRQLQMPIQSIYIGGGTPTSLSVDLLAELLDYIENTIDMSSLEEYTLEAGRPDSIDRDKLRIIRQSRVDRISINPQTMNHQTLQLIGRHHTPEDIVAAFEMAREEGFDNINMDVIAGLPGESIAMFEHTLDQIRELDPDSLTVHTMAVKRGSRLRELRESYVVAGEEEVAAMIDLAQSRAGSMDMHPYYLYRQKNMVGNHENIGYCKQGKESLYNIQIMEDRQTILGFGAGATTKVYYPSQDRLERAFNVKGVEEYMQRLPEMMERKRKLLYAGK